MKVLRSILALILLLSFSDCNHRSKSTQSPKDTLSQQNKYLARITEDVSLITLIANPKQFNGRKVRVIGYLNLEF